MRIQPLSPGVLNAETLYIHNEIANLIGRSQSQVKMIDEALIRRFQLRLEFTSPAWG